MTDLAAAVASLAGSVEGAAVGSSAVAGDVSYRLSDYGLSVGAAQRT